MHVYKYIDKPDFSMSEFVGLVRRIIGKPEGMRFQLLYAVGFVVGHHGKLLAISSIRVKKFCANLTFNTWIEQSGFV